MEEMLELSKSIEMQIYQLKSEYPAEEQSLALGEDSSRVFMGDQFGKTGRNQMILGPENQGLEFVLCSINHTEQKAHMLKGVFPEDWQHTQRGKPVLLVKGRARSGHLLSTWQCSQPTP